MAYYDLGPMWREIFRESAKRYEVWAQENFSNEDWEIWCELSARILEATHSIKSIGDGFLRQVRRTMRSVCGNDSRRRALDLMSVCAVVDCDEDFDFIEPLIEKYKDQNNRNGVERILRERVQFRMPLIRKRGEFGDSHEPHYDLVEAIRSLESAQELAVVRICYGDFLTSRDAIRPYLEQRCLMTGELEKISRLYQKAAA